MELTYPLVVHNEFLTHRGIGRSDEQQFDEWLEFSRNASSNRAIPSSRLIQQVREHPYVPIRWGKSSIGMVPKDEEVDDPEECKRDWLLARDAAVYYCEKLDKSHKLAKQWRNRLLLPFQFITVVATAIDQMWEHFFDLRNHFTAQDEIHHIAKMALQQYNDSIPNILQYGEWHLPYISKTEMLGVSSLHKNEFLTHSGIGRSLDHVLAKSVARCARASHLRMGEITTLKEDIDLYNRMLRPDVGKPHASPFEHQAQAANSVIRSGNFVGWIQYRKSLGI